ncbi:MAG: hypothetical protein Q8N94_02950 [Methanoregula sp.]|nr:hypothetical protein [Methanoregula sp.]
MGDPDLRSDETVLVRTQGVYVKSIPFEGILTNKRIVLVDRAKNLQPPKEIPLATIKDVEGGENAICDPVVTVTVITRSGETRQMILTFSRTAGGNRNKERDEWVKTLKENVSSSYEQVIRKGISGLDQPHKRPEPILSPRIEFVGDPVQPAAARPLPKKEADTIHPIKKIIDNAPSKIPAAVKESDAPAPGFGTFCSRCGNKVPEGSGFCNRCGSSIIPPGSTAPAAPAVPDYRVQAQRPIDREIQTIEPLIERSSVKVPADPLGSVPPEPPVQKTAQTAQSPLYDNPPEPVATQESAPAVTAPQQKPAKTPLIPRLFTPKELAPTPLNPASMPTAASPPPKKPRRAIRMPGKKVFMAIGVIILLIVIAVAGVVFVYPMISGSGTPIPGSATGVPATTSTPVTTSTPASSGTIVIPVETTAPGVPATGVYAHISYIGSWKGTYGMPSDLQKMELSGDHFYEIVNATGPVQATFEKLDGSTRHELVVEIYRNGGLLTTGKTSEGYGKVTVSADATTGVAQVPQIGVGTLTTTAAPTPASG